MSRCLDVLKVSQHGLVYERAAEQSRAVMEWARSMEPLYEVTVDGDDPDVVTEAALVGKYSAAKAAARASTR